MNKFAQEAVIELKNGDEVQRVGYHLPIGVGHEFISDNTRYTVEYVMWVVDKGVNKLWQMIQVRAK